MLQLRYLCCHRDEVKAKVISNASCMPVLASGYDSLGVTDTACMTELLKLVLMRRQKIVHTQ